MQHNTENAVKIVTALIESGVDFTARANGTQICITARNDADMIKVMFPHVFDIKMDDVRKRFASAEFKRELMRNGK